MHSFYLNVPIAAASLQGGAARTPWPNWAAAWIFAAFVTAVSGCGGSSISVNGEAVQGPFFVMGDIEGSVASLLISNAEFACSDLDAEFGGHEGFSADAAATAGSFQLAVELNDYQNLSDGDELPTYGCESSEFSDSEMAFLWAPDGDIYVSGCGSIIVEDAAKLNFTLSALFRPWDVGTEPQLGESPYVEAEVLSWTDCGDF